VTRKKIHRRIERSDEALDAPSLHLVGPAEIDKVYDATGKKGRERYGPSRSRDVYMPDVVRTAATSHPFSSSPTAALDSGM